jgi:hypothetical protein
VALVGHQSGRIEVLWHAFMNFDIQSGASFFALRRIFYCRSDAQPPARATAPVSSRSDLGRSAGSVELVGRRD